MILTSSEFTTKTECKKQTKLLKANIFKKLNVDPKTTVLPRGNILLIGYSKECKRWLVLTNTITQFNRFIEWSNIEKYKLSTTNLFYNNKG